MFKVLRYNQGEFANYEPSGNYMYRQFNIQQFYILPRQTVFMCFVWIWEQTAIISLYNINWLVCITETECVYCAVRTGSSYVIPVSFLSTESVMVLAVISRPLTVHARVRCQFSTCGFFGGQSGRWTIFSPCSSVFPRHNLAPVLHSDPHIHVALTGSTNGRWLVTFQNENSFENFGARIHFFPCYVFNGNHLIKFCNFCWNLQASLSRLLVRLLLANTKLMHFSYHCMRWI